MTKNIKILKSICEAWNEHNEDIWGNSHNTTWVIDGATGLGKNIFDPNGSDAKWFVQHLNQNLKKYTENIEWPLTKILEHSIAEIYDNFVKDKISDDMKPYELPSAAIVIARVKNDFLEVGILGDCKIHVQNKNKKISVLEKETKIGELDQDVINDVEALLKQSYSYSEVRNIILPKLQKNRSLMNQPDGYNILSVYPESARKLNMTNFSIETVESVVMTSDGFYRLVDTFHQYYDNDFMKAIKEESINSLYKKLRNIEENDIDIKYYPRIKPKDDATAILFTLD